MDDINIGPKIQYYREQKKMTQRELAQQINISPSMMSQIERNLANPSLATMKLISKELQVPLYYLFMTDNEEQDIIVRKEQRRIIGSKDRTAPYLELLTPDVSGSIEFIQMTLQPGTESSDKLMNHDGEEVAFVLKGSICLVLEHGEYVMHEGDSVRLSRLAFHKWQNNFKNETKLIFAVTPPKF